MTTPRKDVPEKPVEGKLESLPRSFLDNLEYRASKNPLELGKDLEALAAVDAVYERKERFWATLMWTMFGVALVLFVMMGCTAGISLILALGVFVPLGIFALIMKKNRGRFNLEDRRYLMPREVLRHLAADLPHDQPVEVSLDFNPYHAKEFATNATGSGWSSTSESAYEQPWLSMKGALLDGTRFRLTVTLRVKRKERAKRKWRKVREAFRESIDLTLQFKDRYYPGLDRLEATLKTAPWPTGLKLKHVQLAGQRLELAAETEVQLRVNKRGGGYAVGEKATEQLCSHHSVLGLFVSCYHGLGQCRQAG